MSMQDRIGQSNRQRLPTRLVAKRYNVTPRTLDRWVKDPGLNFPKPTKINDRNYWFEDALDAFDDAQLQGAA
jgi:hypothetical protein